MRSSCIATNGRSAVNTRTLSIVILLLGAAGAASAGQDDSRSGGGQFHDWGNDYWVGAKSHDWFDARGTLTVQAPEIDQDGGHWASHDWVSDYWGGESHEWFDVRSVPTYQAPEIDPVSMVAAMTLLGGAFAVLRGRRPKS
jgi:hypothetical protein